jgi:magnesium-transporting ATPase (P-type)
MRPFAILASSDTMAAQALRVLGAAWRPLVDGEEVSGEPMESDLIYLGASA